MLKNYISGEVKAAKGDGPGEFEVVLSAPTKDRDGEVIDAHAFDPLPDHITFDIDHGLSTATTVGSGRPFYDGDVLKVVGTFSSIPRAQEVRTLVAEGHIRTTSVAFMDSSRTDVDGTPHITKAELLNGAFVPVPSNREAVVLAAKSLAAQAGLRVVEDEDLNKIDTEVIAATTERLAVVVAGGALEAPVEDVSADDTTPAPDPEDTPAATAAGTPPVAGARARAEAVMAEAALLIT